MWWSRLHIESLLVDCYQYFVTVVYNAFGGRNSGPHVQPAQPKARCVIDAKRGVCHVGKLD